MRMRKVNLLVSVLLLFAMVVPSVRAAEESGAEQQSAESTEEANSESEASEASPTESGLSADVFEDLADVPDDVRGKIDALIREGVFNGLSETEFGLNELMNRAQLAKVVALIFSLPIDEALTTSSFSDVSAEFAYAVPYIEALKLAGLTKGSDPEGTLFNPGGEVTRQELAAFLVRGLGLEEEAGQAAPVEDDTVDDWAKAYVALALEKGIMSNLEDGTFGGTVPATREMLAVAAFNARPQEAAKASIVEAKVIGAQLVSVKLNRSVDAAADLEVWSGATSLNRTVEWEDDSMTALITMDKKLTKGKYKVKLVGLEEDAVEKGELEFDASSETLASIEIVAPSTTLPQGKVTLEYKMMNQYGEETTGFHVKVLGAYPNNAVPVLIPGKQALQIDLKQAAKGTPVPVVLMNETAGLSANKLFTVGDKQVVHTIELGELKMKGKDTVLKPGGTAYQTLTLLDQYGFRVTDLETTKRDVMKVVTGEALKTEAQANPFVDYDNDGYPELQLDAVPHLNANKTSTVKLISVASGQTVTQTVNVTVPRLPASIEFAYFDETLVEGDTNKFVEMIVRDANGDKLTADELVNAETTGRLMILSSGPITLGADPAVRTDVTVTPYVNRKVAIQERGTNKGKIRIASIAGFGPASINVYLMTGSEPVRAAFDLYIQPKSTDQRPSSIVVDGGDTSKAVLNLTTTKMKFDILDQYNKDFKDSLPDTKVELKLERISGDAGAVVTTRAVALSDANPTAIKEIKDIADKDIEFVPDRTKTGSYRLTATLVKINPVDQTVLQRLSSATIVADIIDGVNPPLVYDIDVEEDTLYAIGRYTYDRGITTTVTDATYQFNWYNDFGSAIEIRATDMDGRKVVLPSKIITNVMSSNPSAVAANPAMDRIIGLDAGTSKLTVIFNSPTGMHTVSKDITVKYEPLVVNEVKAKKRENKIDSTVINGLFPWDGKLMDQLTIVHNFGEVNSGKSNGVDRFLYYNGLFNGAFVISNLKFAPGTVAGMQDRIYVGPDYKIVYIPASGNPSDNNLIGFTISFVMPNGKTVTCDVEVQ